MAGDLDGFRAALARSAAIWSVPCDRAQTDAIVRFASLLLTWTARINLTGAVSLSDLAAEHLPDSLALASRLGTATLQAVDVGSGGGLPALPLSVLCPGLSLRLLEPIAKKAAFLRTAVRELDLGARVVVDTRRVQAVVPAAFDVAMSRATFPPRAWTPLAVKLVHPGGRVFVLVSAGADEGAPPPPLEVVGRWPYLDGRRQLIELLRPPT